jgi:hypothetical protein
MATIELLKNLRIGRYEPTAFSAEMVGKLVFEKIVQNDLVSIKCTNEVSGLTEVVVIDTDVADQTDAAFTVVFAAFGIQISGQTTVAHAHPLFNTMLKRMIVIADNICAATTDVVLRAAVPVDVNIPFGASVLPARTDADLSLGDYQGWVLYKEPTANDLSSDTSSPNNMWQPYFGDWNEISRVTTSLIPMIKRDRSFPSTLPNGSVANRFDYVWGEYEPISDVFMQKKYDGTAASVTFTIADETVVTPTRLNVYLNGIYQDASKAIIVKNVVDCAGIAPNTGDVVTIIYKAYSPSKVELAFDPDTDPASDNPVQTVQYKYDYQYTMKEIRNSDGVLVNTLYYFWVANKNLITRSRKLSIQAAKNLLKNNTNPYAILQNISSTGSTPRYNQFIGMGLNRYITEDDTYKIRFTRDFILRDDPRDIELKNVHTEWAMIREQQNTLIPESLWNHLVDAACGQNMVGDAVPSLARVAYDERNGTKSRYGFGDGQAFVDKQLALNSIKHAILNTSLTTISPANPGVEVPDPIEFIDMNALDELFGSAPATRKTMNDIWTKAKPKQVNEIFFTVLYDALAENYEFTDIFKTSMIAAHSIRLFSKLEDSNEN